MPKRYRLDLTPEQRQELERVRDTDPRPYMRERAAAILKVADGQAARQVAQHGLLKRRDKNTVCEWVRRYQAEGLKGLQIKPGRGRKPAFSPHHATEEAAAAELREVVRRSPRLYGLKRSRWWLDGLRQKINWLNGLSLSGVYRVLRRLRISYKRGRRYVHSPDPEYDEKLALLQTIQELVAAEPKRFVLLYEDELTYYRRPTVAQGYAVRGSDEPRARQGLRANLYQRIAASLDVSSGRLFAWQRKHFDRWTLIRYYQALEAAYPEAELIFVAQDNWPVHFHDDVLAALVGSRIILVPLPTYAPWTNPIEKVWRKLYQEVLHLHDFADCWDELKAEVDDWLDQFADRSTELLRYVGLCPN